MSLSLTTPDELSHLDLPEIVVGPTARPLGQIWHVVRPAISATVLETFEVQMSPRRTATAYRLSSGDTVVIWDKRLSDWPAEIDGVIRYRDNKPEWLYHEAIETISSQAAEAGWRATSREIANDWNGKFAFRAEGRDSTGLRPPQIGALHAIGAHWSLHSQPATIVMPTGTGKTEAMLATLAAYRQQPLLVVVPWTLLRSQTTRKFLTFGLLRDLGVLAGDARNPVVGVVTRRPQSEQDLDIFEECNVVVATMSSLAGGNAIDLAGAIASKVDTLIVDEAHHIGAEKWSKFREAFSSRRILQFTATPFRRDRKLVDGHVIYNYPLRVAQEAGFFKKITFEPVCEIDQGRADQAIADRAIAQLQSDLSSGFDHLILARCASVKRAEKVHELYETLAPDLNPLLIHSELPKTDVRVQQLTTGASRVAVCVDMLGEGFDLPPLKIAALHDAHKSLAITLQFIGRFTRTAGDTIGNATAVANIADAGFAESLERLYSEDADWNEVLSELSSEAAREHAALLEFLNHSQRLGEDPEDFPISHKLLQPTLSTLVYQADQFQPRRFHEGLPASMQVKAAWLHSPSNTLFFVTLREEALKWTRSKEIKDRQWDLFVLHFDQPGRLLFLSSTEHGSLYEKLARSVGGSAIISGDRVFRVLSGINRLMFQNIGVRKHGRRNLSYAMYTGSDVAQALSLAERTGSIKSNLSGVGWEGGKHITVGCSYKGRVWTREQAPIPAFVEWCAQVGTKLNDESVDTSQIIAHVLIPTEVDRIPDTMVLALDWPIELLRRSEENVTFTRGDEELPLSLLGLELVETRAEQNEIAFRLISAEQAVWCELVLQLGVPESFRVMRTSALPVEITVGALQRPLEDYFSSYPPLVRFVDLSELDGDLLISAETAPELVIPDDRFVAWNWSGVDITKESIWKDGVERRNSIQWRAAEHFRSLGFTIVFDDDAAVEAADLVCLREEQDYIALALVHCKFSGEVTAGARVKDVVEVCSQAIRSAKWKWKFRDLCKHITGRETRLTNDTRPSRFISGSASELNRFLRLSKFKEIRPEIFIVQPGLSASRRSREQTLVLAAACSYLKETIGIDLDVVCSD